MNIRKELIEASGVTPGHGETEGSFTRRLAKEINDEKKFPDAKWQALSPEAQAFVNSVMEIDEGNKDERGKYKPEDQWTAFPSIPGKYDVEVETGADEQKANAEGEVVGAEAPSNEKESSVVSLKKKVAKVKPAKAEKAAKPEKVAKPVKVKPAKAEKAAKPEKVAKAKGNGKARGTAANRGRPASFSLGAKITVVNKDPFRAGTKCAGWFASIKNGMTVEQALAAGAPRHHIRWAKTLGHIAIKESGKQA